MGGLREQPHAGEPHQPHVEGAVVSHKIEKTNPYQQAGERYRSIEQWERDDLVLNLVTALNTCRPEIQERMVSHLTRCDAGCGALVATGLGLKAMAMVVGKRAPVGVPV